MFRRQTDRVVLISRSFAIVVLALAASGWCWAQTPSADAAFDFGAGRFSPRALATGGQRAENAPHNMAISLTDAGFRVESLSAESPWLLSFEVTGYGRGDLVQPPGAVQPTASGPHAQLRPTADVTLDLLNSADGLHFDFLLDAPPAGGAFAPGEAAYLQLRFGGDLRPLPDEGATAVSFLRSDDQPVVRMNFVSATDAAGREVPTRWEFTSDAENAPGAAKLVLDAPQRTFPIRVSLVAGDPKVLRSLEQPAMSAPAPVNLNKTAAAVAERAGESTPVAPLKLGDVGTQAVPPNDECAGAVIIPNAAFPVLSSTADLTDATTTGDPTSVCSPFDSTVWYLFTAPTTAKYIISDCAGAGATGTTMPDTVISVYNTTGGCAAPGNFYACNNTDPACTTGAPPDQSTVTPLLIANTQYYIVVGRYSGVGATPKSPGFTNVQVRIDRVPPPTNDLCTAAIPLQLDRAVDGTTIAGGNEYQSPSTTACYSGLGQTLTTAPGRDVVYSFTAPTAGRYSFRVNSYNTLQNPALYVASDCPTAGNPPRTPTCLAGANRSFNNTDLAEEVMCQTLTAGQLVYLYVDDQAGATLNNGSDFNIEVNRCTLENDTANNSQATADALACPIEGSTNAAGDVDWYNLGTPPSGDRVFAIADGVAGNTGNWDMRITTAADTLEYDNQDNVKAFGQLGPNIAGAPLTGVQSYIRMNLNSGSATGEPYRLYSVVEPPMSSAVPEVEPNDTLPTATFNYTGYYYGNASIGSGGDVDIYRFCANQGDLIYVGADGDPLRNNTPFDVTAGLFDQEGFLLFADNDTTATSSTTPGTGNLTSTTPNSPGEGILWRARYSGLYYAGVWANTATTGDYLLSLTANCATGSQQSADVGVSMTASPNPVATGALLTYTITVADNGPNTGLAATLADSVPANTTFHSFSVIGLAGDWQCTTPSVGGTGTVSCTDFCLTSGSTTTFQLVVSVNGCAGGGGSILNTATVTTSSTDPNSANNSASTSTSVTDNGQCSDGNACTTSDHCVGTTCVGGAPPNCSDSVACTVDTCDPVSGCIHTPNNAACDDSNICTADTCSVTLGCQHAPQPDSDGDGYCDPADCDAADNQIWKPPTEVAHFIFDAPASNKQNFHWDSEAVSSGPATRYDVMRGSTAEFPVGGGPSEICLFDNLAAPNQSDSTLDPDPGTAFYYLVRAENVCGIATYGNTSSGAPRNTNICLP